MPTKQQSSQCESPQTLRLKKTCQVKSATRSVLLDFFDIHRVVNREFVPSSLSPWHQRNPSGRLVLNNPLFTIPAKNTRSPRQQLCASSCVTKASEESSLPLRKRVAEVVNQMCWSKIMAKFHRDTDRRVCYRENHFLDRVQEVMQPCKGLIVYSSVPAALKTPEVHSHSLCTSHLTAIRAMHLDLQNMHLLSNNLPALYLNLSRSGTKSDRSLSATWKA